MKKLLILSGVDKTISYVIIAKSWSVLSGVLILAIISKFLTSEEQGYYFTFVSVLGLQVLFELGFGTIVIQFISHEMPFLVYNKSCCGGNITGEQYHLSRFYSIVKLILKWYFFVCLALLFFVLPFGFYFFSNGTEAINWYSLYNENTVWSGAWLALVLSAALSSLITPMISIAEGCGLVFEISRVRFIQSVFSSVIALTFIYFGLGLYAVTAPLLSLLLVGSVWIYKYFINIIIAALATNQNPPSISWRKEILPVQWRIAISWISGYFIFQLFTPVSFKVYGAEFAGKLGMSINITNLLLNFSLSWIITRMPKFGNLIAKGDYPTLNKLFITTFKQSAFFLILLIFSSMAFLYISSWLGLFYMTRILLPEQFFILCLAILGNHIIACQATYIRAHRVELYVFHSVLTAFLIILMLSQTSRFDYVWMISIYTMIVWGVCVPYSTIIYVKFKREKNINV